tara:strand:- start:312 stop:692 length:381 start_codon:yes stop_codon:yes gene_type:complete
MTNYNSTSRTPFAKGGRAGFKQGSKGSFQKIKEKISRKIRGKELTDVKGIEQDVKTGYLTHNAPKDRLDTAPGRKYKGDVATWSRGMPIPKAPKSNDMSYEKRKKEIAKDKKEADRKKAFDKKHGV